MAKLHEILAVQSQLKGQVAKKANDIVDLFSKKSHHFRKTIVTFTPNQGDGQQQTEEQSELQATVNKELSWVAEAFNQLIDTNHAISKANTVAKADVVLDDGTKLLSDIPATTLLELEKELTNFKNIIAAVPTLDPAKGFNPDTSLGSDIFKAREVVKTRTQKKSVPLVLAQATDKHPAQVQLVSEDVPTGTIRQNEWASMWTPSQKASALDGCEIVIRAVKAARSRANDVKVEQDKIGAILTGHILKSATK